MKTETIKLTGTTSNDTRNNELMPHFTIDGTFSLMESYRRDAKRILDQESKSLNPHGIKRLLSALMVEVYGDENYGKHN